MARGDHLYYFMAGGTYSHHGLDCGDGTVIHYDLTPMEKLTEKWQADTSDAKIVRTTVDEFSKGNELHVRAYEDADDVEVVVERALSRIGDDGYSVVGNNCEHFVVWCKTGDARSSQVDAHKTAAATAAATVAAGAPLGLVLLRAARKVPGPYRKFATMGAIGLAGAVYLATYVKNRMRQRAAGVS